MLLEHIKVGASVYPRTQRLSCAVVTKIEDLPEGQWFTVLTDFGNILRLSSLEFTTMYQNEQYVSMLPLESGFMTIYQDPFDFNIDARFHRQVELLREAQANLKSLGLLKTDYL